MFVTIFVALRSTKDFHCHRSRKTNAFLLLLLLFFYFIIVLFYFIIVLFSRLVSLSFGEGWGEDKKRTPVYLDKAY
jgi:hypothetical protein